MTVIKELSPKNVLQKLSLGQKLKYEAVFWHVLYILLFCHVRD